MQVCSEGIHLVYPLICFSRGPNVRRSRIGAWMAKERLALGLFVTPEVWRWPAVSRVTCGRLGIHQHTGHYLRFDKTVVNALGS